MQTIYTALRITLGLRAYQLISGISFFCFLPLYLVTLPAPYTGGRIELESLQYLTPAMILGSILMAALGSMIIIFITYLIGRGHRSRKASAAGGLIVGVAAPLLCCSPVLFTLLGLLAIALPSVAVMFGLRFQWFVATHQLELFTFAALLLVFGLYQNARLIIACSLDSSPSTASRCDSNEISIT